MKPLFDVGSSNKNSDTTKKLNKQTAQSQKKSTNSKVSKHNTTVSTKKITTKSNTAGWHKLENFYKSLTPDTPYEFCVDIGDKRIARGYLSSYGGLCSDDPWIVSVMKHKNGFIYYRKLCSDLQACPDNFPRCKDCKKYKK